MGGYTNKISPEMKKFRKSSCVLAFSILVYIARGNNITYGDRVLFLLIAIINVWTTELAITIRRIIAKTGLIRRNTIELKVIS